MKKMFALCLSLAMVFSLTACGGDSSGSGGSADADDPGKVYTITLAHQYATTTAFQDMCLWWQEQLETRSDGRLKVEIFPAAQLMPADQQFTALLDGRIQAGISNAALLAGFDESFCIFEMPFLFGDSYESLDTIAEFCRTDEFKELVLKPVEDKGILCYPTYLDGARELITTKVPVKTLEDLKGLKIRSTGGRFAELTGNAYGFSAIAIAAAELPTALMQGTVDGAMLNPVYVYQVKSPVSYFTIIPFDYTAVDPITVSLSFYNSLPEDLQKLMDDVGEELFDYSLKYTRDLMDYSYQMIEEDMGCEIYTLSDADYAQAAEQAKQVWDAYTGQISYGGKLVELASKITAGVQGK